MKKILICLIIALCLSGCNKEAEKTIINKEYIENITMKKEYIIVDVRTKEEYDELHVKNSINIPVDELETNTLNKEKIIFVYCKSGNRSNVAYNTLKKLGFEVYDLGGIDNISLEKIKED